jgi:hypothetical protein
MTVDITLDLEYQLRAFLLAAPDIVAIVGSNGVFPAPAPQNTRAPYVTFQRISAQREYDIYGYAMLAGPMIQIDCWVDAPEYNGNYAGAKLLAQAVRQTMNAFRGYLGPLRVQQTTIDSERDYYEQQDHTRRVSFDFRFWFEEDH